MGWLRVSTIEDLQRWTKPGRAGCWLWTRSKTAAGYGAKWWKGRLTYAHRIAFELAVGPIPEGMLVCHRCDTPACCNPDHLFLGTDKSNLVDMQTKGRGDGGRRKLSREQHATARAGFARGMTIASLARAFGLSPSAMHYVIHGRPSRRLAPAKLRGHAVR